MALIVSGGLAATISGKIGNTVFSRNAGGAYVRNYAKPVNPQTPLQAAIRNAFSATVAAWSTLNASEQNAFVALAAASPVPNRVGLTTQLPPLSTFQRINVGRVVAGLNIVTTAPLAPITDDWNPGAFALQETGSSTSIRVVYDGSSGWVASTDQDALLIFVSPPQSFNVNFYKGKFNFLGGITGAGGTGGFVNGVLFGGINQVTGGGTTGQAQLEFNGQLPPIPPGGRIFYRAYVTRADGHTGPEATGFFDHV